MLADRSAGAEAASVAHRTVGLVARETGFRVPGGIACGALLLLPRRGSWTFARFEARLSLALVLLQGGYPAAALVELDRAAEGAPRELRGQVLMQRAVIHIRIGRFEEALETAAGLSRCFAVSATA